MKVTERTNQQWKDEYDSGGVVLIREFLSSDEVSGIREELDRYIREDLSDRPDDAATREADGEQVRNLWRLEKYNPELREFAEKKDVLKLVGKLVNGEPVLAAIETFNKPAKVGSGVPPHQDTAYFCRTPADMLTVWIALDPVTSENGPVTSENGPVTYVKGSHTSGVLATKPSGVKGNSIGLADSVEATEENEWRGLLRPGDATIHYSAPNTTDKARLGFLMVYRGGHTEVDPMLQKTYHAAASTVV